MVKSPGQPWRPLTACCGAVRSGVRAPAMAHCPVMPTTARATIRPHFPPTTILEPGLSIGVRSLAARQMYISSCPGGALGARLHRTLVASLEVSIRILWFGAGLLSLHTKSVSGDCLTGSHVKQNNGGEYFSTKFARQGDLGTQLPAQPHGVQWVAGSVVQTSLFIKANHAGGWQYRLCPTTEPLTEQCFQR